MNTKWIAPWVCMAAGLTIMLAGCRAIDPVTGKMETAEQIQFNLNNYLATTQNQIDSLNVEIANNQRMVTALDAQLDNDKTQTGIFIDGIGKLLNQTPGPAAPGLATGLGLVGVALHQDNRRKDRKIAKAQDDSDAQAKAKAKNAPDPAKVQPPTPPVFDTAVGPANPTPAPAQLAVDKLLAPEIALTPGVVPTQRTKVFFYLTYPDVLPATKKLVVTGSGEALKNWHFELGVDLSASKVAGVWYAEVDLPVAQPVEYKYVMMNKDGPSEHAWEKRNLNRQFTPSKATEDRNDIWSV